MNICFRGDSFADLIEHIHRMKLSNGVVRCKRRLFKRSDFGIHLFYRIDDSFDIRKSGMKGFYNPGLKLVDFLPGHVNIGQYTGKPEQQDHPGDH